MKNIIKSIIFLGILAILLKGLSWISIQMTCNKTLPFQFASRSLFTETDHSVDVIYIGDSNVYSGISPMEIWKKTGISSYAWGEPSQRISETYEYLKEIYKKQTPKIVFIECGNLYRDKTMVNNLDSMIKSKIEIHFPLVAYHKNMGIHRLNVLFQEGHSVSKGYFLRKNVLKMKRKKVKLKKGDQVSAIHFLSQWELKKCIELCNKNGSQVILFSMPVYRWNVRKKEALSSIAEKNHTIYLDLNTILNDDIDWKADTTDGVHLNISGATKVSKWFSDYLSANYKLLDHRKDDSYGRWNTDLEQYERLK